VSSDTPKVPKYWNPPCLVFTGMPRLTLCGDVATDPLRYVTNDFNRHLVGLVPCSLGHVSSSGTKESGIFALFDVYACMI
jgi:hypothetical protein